MLAGGRAFPKPRPYHPRPGLAKPTLATPHPPLSVPAPSLLWGRPLVGRAPGWAGHLLLILQTGRLRAQGSNHHCHPEPKCPYNGISAGRCLWPPASRVCYNTSNKEGNTYMGAESLRRVPTSDSCWIHPYCHIILHPHGLGLTSIKLP